MFFLTLLKNKKGSSFVLLRRTTQWVIAIAMASVLTSCSTSTRKLDEAIIYDGPRFKLKLVRYYENLPLHYNGEVFHVQCASANTANSPAHKSQDAGWISLGSGGAIGSRNAQEMVERERPHYHVMDENTLVWTGIALNVSFDGCGSFHRWDPTTLPPSMIDPVEKPSYCAPQGSADCRYYDFQGGDRLPHYEEIRTDPRGIISFLVQAKSFKNGGTLIVQSMDFGKTWKTTWDVTWEQRE